MEMLKFARLARSVGGFHVVHEVEWVLVES